MTSESESKVWVSNYSKRFEDSYSINDYITGVKYTNVMSLTDDEYLFLSNNTEEIIENLKTHFIMRYSIEIDSTVISIKYRLCCSSKYEFTIKFNKVKTDMI